jgi:hypothetical protein
MKKCMVSVMSCCLLLLVSWVLCFSGASAEVIKELALDDTDSLGTVIDNDDSVKTEGSHSMRIRTLWPTTICLGEVTGLDIDESTLIYQAKVRSELVEGVAYLEMWCHVDGGKYFSRGKNAVVRGSRPWHTLETPFFLQQGQKVEKVTLNVVIEGTGTIWLDAVTLIRQPLQ